MNVFMLGLEDAYSTIYMYVLSHIAYVIDCVHYDHRKTVRSTVMIKMIKAVDISYWHPDLTISVVDDQSPWQQGSISLPLDKCKAYAVI